jgi:predicted SAM-dependent methyltransferase
MLLKPLAKAGINGKKLSLPTLLSGYFLSETKANKSKMETYVQYGCGLSAPAGWINFDSSPTLKIQKTPLLGNLVKGRLNTVFPDNVKFGDIVKGLPIANESCDAIYCSHVLEHLSLEDFRIALKNTHKLLKRGGLFRLVMPDFEVLVNSYVNSKKNGNPEAAIKFMKDSGMALESRTRGMKGMLEGTLGNARHQWLWDDTSTMMELEKAGFKHIRKCALNDSSIEAFKLVEDADRFRGALAFEMTR